MLRDGGTVVWARPVDQCEKDSFSTSTTNMNEMALPGPNTNAMAPPAPPKASPITQAAPRVLACAMRPLRWPPMKW